jgi:cell division protein FtsN
MSDRINTDQDKKNMGENKSTIIITITLLLILVVFFAGYSIANGPNFDKFTLQSNSMNNDYVNDYEDSYSYLSENSDDSINIEEENNALIEENITGEIGSDDNNFFKDNSISFKDPEIHQNENEETIEMMDTSSTEGESYTHPEPEDVQTKPKEETDVSVEQENNKTQLKTKKPIIHNLKSYDNEYQDHNINPENPYIIQVATHNHKKSAQHIRDILILEGFNAYVFETLINKETKYRIRVGSFSSKREALRIHKNLLSNSNVKGIENSIILKKKY